MSDQGDATMVSATELQCAVPEIIFFSRGHFCTAMNNIMLFKYFWWLWCGGSGEFYLHTDVELKKHCKRTWTLSLFCFSINLPFCHTIFNSRQQSYRGLESRSDSASANFISKSKTHVRFNFRNLQIGEKSPLKRKFALLAIRSKRQKCYLFYYKYARLEGKL